MGDSSVCLRSKGLVIWFTVALVTSTVMVFVVAPFASAAPGSLDTTFGTGGKVTTDFGGINVGRAVVLLLDGSNRILVAGDGPSSYDAEGRAVDTDFAIAQYSPSGSLVGTNFGTNGKLVTDFGGIDRAWGAALIGSNNIVVVGTGGPGKDFALARYSTTSGLDPSFGTDGKVTTDFGGPNDIAYAVAVEKPDSEPFLKIVAVGTNGGNFALARYGSAGGLDTSFGTDGKVTTAGTTEAYAVALQPDGKIVAAGRTTGDFALVRYNPNGSLDTTFGTDGKVTTDVTGFPDRAQAVALQPDGKIVAAGYGGATDDFALARYNPNGSLDMTFGTDGTVTTAGTGAALAMALQPDGKIVVAGESDGSPTDFLVVRYNPNGSLDTTFGAITDFGGRDLAFGVALQPDGKIVAVGQGSFFGGFPISARSGDFALARYEVALPPPPPPPPILPDTPGVVNVDNAQWYLANSAGAVTNFEYGNPTDLPISGDWDGNPTSTPGLYRSLDSGGLPGGFFYARNFNSTGIANDACFGGNPSDIPVSGDWDGDGDDTLGIMRLVNNQPTFYLFNNSCVGTAPQSNPFLNALGAAQISFEFGDAGDTPVVGDWDGDGKDEIGLYRRSNGFFYNRETLSTGAAHNACFAGDPSDYPIGGDWDGDGDGNFGIFRPADQKFFLFTTSCVGLAPQSNPFANAMGAAQLQVPVVVTTDTAYLASLVAADKLRPVSGAFGLG